MIKFNMTGYPGSNCETELTIKIGTMREIAPDYKNYDPDNTYGFKIEVTKGSAIGESHYGIKDSHKAQATAMLRAVAYGNGSFPLDSLLR